MFEIAYALGIPVYQIENEMPYTELLKWVTYFRKQPRGWREDQRAVMIMRSFGFKGKDEDVFPSLRAMKHYAEEQRAAREDSNVTPSGMFLQKMLKAKNGDNSGWKPSFK